MYKNLTYAISNGVATLKLNRPEVYNAFNDELTYELQEALKSAAKDEQVRVLVLTGEGKAFCSGQDLKAVSGAEKRSFMESLHKRYNPIIRAMRSLPKPIVCRLNGVAAGAGCSLALACDIIVASTEATLIEALALGLINKVAEPDQLDAAVAQYTDYFAKAPTGSIGLIKKMLNKSTTSTLDEMLDYEAYCQEIAGTSVDYKEGVQAFLEKRKPDFKGK